MARYDRKRVCERIAVERAIATALENGGCSTDARRYNS